MLSSLIKRIVPRMNLIIMINSDYKTINLSIYGKNPYTFTKIKNNNDN